MRINVPAGNFPLQLGADVFILNTSNVYLECKTSGGAINIILPRITTIQGITTPWGFKVFVNDFDNNAAINNISLVPNPADKINGVFALPLVLNTNGTTGILQISGDNSWEYSGGGTGGGGVSGFSGYSGFSGLNGSASMSGFSGQSGFSGVNGVSGYSGFSGTNGINGVSGYSGFSGENGTSGFSGTNGADGTSGYSGFSGLNGLDGFGASGYSGFSGSNGTNGASGFSGSNGADGTSGYSGFSGTNGTNGVSGYSGFSGLNGLDGFGASGYSGFSGLNGLDGFGASGYSGFSGANGTSGYSGINGVWQAGTGANSAQLIGSGSLAGGDESVAEGLNTVISAGATGSHAEGKTTTAIGAQAHAEGLSTTAKGDQSHSEGSTTKAIGQASHAEGNLTTAIGDHSHAEGQSSKSKGQDSHAEGNATTAGEFYSHSEGLSTTTMIGATASHAEGFNTITFGQFSHAEGQATNSIGKKSHAEGESTIAIGEASHSEGSGSQANANNSHAEGQSTVADFGADNSHAEGFGSSTEGQNSHAEGNFTIANNTNAHAEGDTTMANGVSSHAEGEFTVANQEASHTEGSHTTTSQSFSHAQGFASLSPFYGTDAQASGAFSFAGDAQRIVATLRNTTTDGSTVTPLTLDGLSGLFARYLSFNNFSFSIRTSWEYTLRISGIDITNGNNFNAKISGGIKNYFSALQSGQSFGNTGTLISGVIYTILSSTVGDDFSNAGTGLYGTVSTAGYIFISNGNVPNVWGGSTGVVAIHNVAPTAQTSGSLIANNWYIIDSYNGADDFSGASSFTQYGTINTSGCIFIANGSAPVWTGGSSLVLIPKQNLVGAQLADLLVIGKTYVINSFIAGDNFSNVANVIYGSINQTGCVFVATGTTPTTWTNHSTIVPIDFYSAIDPRVAVAKVLVTADATTNSLLLTVVGVPSVNMKWVASAEIVQVQQ